MAVGHFWGIWFRTFCTKMAFKQNRSFSGWYPNNMDFTWKKTRWRVSLVNSTELLKIALQFFSKRGECKDWDPKSQSSRRTIFVDSYFPFLLFFLRLLPWWLFVCQNRPSVWQPMFVLCFVFLSVLVTCQSSSIRQLLMEVCEHESRAVRNY